MSTTSDLSPALEQLYAELHVSLIHEAQTRAAHGAASMRLVTAKHTLRTYLKAHIGDLPPEADFQVNLHG
jgi:hypothetical protein